jgi:DNA-binding Lrp family transcriptional regulator
LTEGRLQVPFWGTSASSHLMLPTNSVTIVPLITSFPPWNRLLSAEPMRACRFLPPALLHYITSPNSAQATRSVRTWLGKSSNLGALKSVWFIVAVPGPVRCACGSSGQSPTGVRTHLRWLWEWHRMMIALSLAMDLGVRSRFDRLDWQTVRLLQRSGRAPSTGIAREPNASERRERSRVRPLVECNATLRTAVVSHDPLVTGLWCMSVVHISRMEEIAHTIARLCQVNRVAYSTGHQDISLQVLLQSSKGRHRLLQSLPGIPGANWPRPLRWRASSTTHTNGLHRTSVSGSMQAASDPHDSQIAPDGRHAHALGRVVARSKRARGVKRTHSMRRRDHGQVSIRRT